MEALGFTSGDFYYILPELVLAAGALLVLVVDLIVPGRDRLTFALTLATVIASGGVVLSFAGVDVMASQGLLAIDGFARFFKGIFLVSAVVTIMMSARYLRVEGVRPAEYYFLILSATLGMMFMASGVDLITLFIGLETMAISFYILVGYVKPSPKSNEAAVKYFLLGAFSLGILLYGMSILYGVTGTTNLREIATVLAGQERSLLLGLALILVGAGMGFKIAAVPFHMWAPDVYEGAPTPVTAFLSVGSKAASFAMLLRILFEGTPRVDPRLADPVRGAGGRLNDRREHRGDHTEQRQTDAGLLVDRARRVRADWRCGRNRAGRDRGARVSLGLSVHAARSVCRRHDAAPA